MTRRSIGPTLLTLLTVAGAARAEPDTFFLGDGRDGALVLSSGQTSVVNGYARVTAALGPGDSSIPISLRPSNVVGFAAGDLVLIHQTTGLVPAPASNNGSTPVDLGSDPVGRFEFARILSATSTNLVLTAPLFRSFAGSVSQVIKVPEYTAVTVPLNAQLEALPWDGMTGGVLAFLVNGTLTLNGVLQLSGDGFRGGDDAPNYAPYDCDPALMELANTVGGSGKGEGIAFNRYPGASGRGALANAGGGGICHNSGGGGGGNRGAGGLGGESSDLIAKGGYGGAALTFSPYDRLLLGGGGGAGQQNDSGSTRGGDGGGIILVRARSLAGTGDIEANGAGAATAVSDGAGGGGAGGTIHFRLVDSASCDDFEVEGGKGGDVDTSDHGTGGGGGGGIVLAQGSSWTACSTYFTGGGNSGIDQALGGPEGATGGGNGAIIVDGVSFSLPAAPTLSTPPSVTNDGTPAISGTSPVPGAPVLVFVDGVYLATVISSGTGAFSLSPSANLASGSHSTFAHLEQKGVHSLASGSRTFTVDRVTPDTQLDSTPALISNAASDSFAFSRIETTSHTTVSFECASGTSATPTNWAACTSPSTVTPAEGPFTFRVRARDAAGNVDSTPSSYSWTIDRTAPETDATGIPPALTRQQSWSFDFTSPDATATFHCQLDQAASFTACPTPFTTPVLPDGAHTLQIRAQDPAGNVDPTPVSVSWTVDATPPVTTLQTAPPATTAEASFSFSFTANESSSFECNLDGAGFSACTSPQGVTVGEGSHTFAVRATDPAGNLDSTGASAAWRVEFLDPAADRDADGLDETSETAAGTSPTNPDTDGDGLPDGVEVRGGNPTNPLDPDSDEDGLVDGAEDANSNGSLDGEETDPNDADSDDGGVDDGLELQGNTHPLEADDDFLIRGGCSTTPGRPAANALLWGSLAVLTLGLRRRRGTAALLAAAGVLIAHPAQAQSTSIDVQQLKPAPGAGSVLGLHGAGVDPHLGWRVGALVSYGDRPLAMYLPATNELVGGIVAGQATLDLLAAISFADLVEVGAALPVSYQLASGQTLPGQGPALVPLGLGDVRVTPKLKLLSLGTFKLGVAGEVTLPTAGSSPFLGSGGLSARPRIAAEYSPLPSLRLLLNAGANLRAPQRLLNLSVGNEVAGGVGAEAALPWARMQAALTLTGALGLTASGPETVPAEVLGAVRVPVGAGLLFTVGGGAGVGSGYGTPRFRVLAAVSFEPKPLAASRGEPPPPPARRSCAHGPEDFDGFEDDDGCADPDNDRDGVPDAKDSCLNQPETKNDWEEADGCPDTAPARVLAKDADGDSVSDDLDLCPDLAGEADEDGCPPDDDNDGIVNPLDQCPTRKETINGYQDDDGCPDSAPRRGR